MRKLIVCNIVSLDGYHEGPGNDVMAMPFDEGFDRYNAERLRAADTLLLGRTSYEGFKATGRSLPMIPTRERLCGRSRGATTPSTRSSSRTA